MDVIVLHLFENDIAEQTPEQCMEKFSKMTNDIKRKFTDVKVIVSLGLPQRDEGIHRKISKLNVLLTEKLGDVNYVSLCDNENLFYRGNPSRGMPMDQTPMENIYQDREPGRSGPISNIRSTRHSG